jgi:hypothetical protein
MSDGDDVQRTPSPRERGPKWGRYTDAEWEKIRREDGEMTSSRAFTMRTTIVRTGVMPIGPMTAILEVLKKLEAVGRVLTLMAAIMLRSTTSSGRCLHRGRVIATSRLHRYVP